MRMTSSLKLAVLEMQSKTPFHSPIEKMKELTLQNNLGILAGYFLGSSRFKSFFIILLFLLHISL